MLDSGKHFIPVQKCCTIVRSLRRINFELESLDYRVSSQLWIYNRFYFNDLNGWFFFFVKMMATVDL